MRSSGQRNIICTCVMLALVVGGQPFLKAQFGQTMQYFSQFAIGGGAETFFTVHNPGESAVTVGLELFSPDGTLFVDDQVQVAPSATQTVAYGGSAGQTQNGWARLSAELPFSASVFFKIAQIGNVGVVPGRELENLKFFAFVQKGTRTGVAIANPNETDPSVLTFRLFDGMGQFIGQVQLTLQPRNHLAVFLDEPPFNLVADGSVDVSATQPVIGLSLRIDNSLLASVPLITPRIATGVTGYEQSFQTESFTGLAGCTSSRFSCPEGKVVLSGSALLTAMAAADRPLIQVDDHWTDQSSWTAQVCNYNAHNVEGTVGMYLVCATSQ